MIERFGKRNWMYFYGRPVSRLAWDRMIQCTNPKCRFYKQMGRGNIKKASNRGKYKWICTECHTVFNEYPGVKGSKLAWERSVFCKNPTCTHYQKPRLGNIVKASNYGKHKGKIRWKCKICRKTFTMTRGSLIYKKKLSREDIFNIYLGLKKRMSITTMAGLLGVSRNTIYRYLKENKENIKWFLMSYGIRTIKNLI